MKISFGSYLVILFFPDTEVVVSLSYMVDQDCPELSGVKFVSQTSHSSRIASWSSRMLVQEPCGVAATYSTVTH